MRKPASKEITSDSLELCENRSLFLTHPTSGNECSNPEDTQDSSRSWFWVLRDIRLLGFGWSVQDFLYLSHYLAEMLAGEHRDTHGVEQTKKMVPHVTHETQHIWFGSLVLTWFCRATNQAQLCGFWTRVSLLDFVLWWSSWSRLHCSQKMYNWNSPWEECVLVGTISTVDNWSTSRLLFSFGAVLSQSSIQRNDYCFCRTVGYWRLLLAHPTDGDKCSASKDT